MQRFKKFIYYKLVHAWRELQGGHPFGMFRACLEGIFKGSSFHVRPEKCGGMSQFFRDTTDKFAVCFRLALTHMPSFKRKPVAGGGKQLTRGLAPSGIVNPLRGDCLAPVSRLESAMTDKFGNGTAIDRPKFAEKTDAAKLAEISEFHGITDIHSFNGFNSFYDFLRNTFFHTRYVLVTGKDTENVSMPVYNLSINKDESYVLPIGIVHNCRCTVVQVRKDKYPLSDETQAMNLGSQATAGKHQEMFMYNPGKKMTTFPAYNAYTRKACIECPYSGGNIKLAKVPDNELCQACKVVREMKKDNNKSEIQESIQTIISQLENGYPKGESLIIGQLSGDIKEFVRKKGIELISDDIYISDKQIRHALRPVKQKAGKAVTAEQLAAFPALMEDCEVYWDETAGNIQFITRQDGKVQKFVVSLNYITKILGEKKMVNAFITAGTLEERNLGMRNLVKIK